MLTICSCASLGKSNCASIKFALGGGGGGGELLGLCVAEAIFTIKYI